MGLRGYSMLLILLSFITPQICQEIKGLWYYEWLHDSISDCTKRLIKELFVLDFIKQLCSPHVLVTELYNQIWKSFCFLFNLDASGGKPTTQAFSHSRGKCTHMRTTSKSQMGGILPTETFVARWHGRGLGWTNSIKREVFADSLTKVHVAFALPEERLGVILPLPMRPWGIAKLSIHSFHSDEWGLSRCLAERGREE